LPPGRALAREPADLPRAPAEAFVRAPEDAFGRAREDAFVRELVPLSAFPSLRSSASSRRLSSRTAPSRSRTSSLVAGRRSSSAPLTRLRARSAPVPAPRTRSSTASWARPRVVWAEATVAWIVRSTASRTASGTLGGADLRRAIGLSVSHIVPAISGSPVHLRPTVEPAPRALLPGDPHRALAIARSVLDRPRPFNVSRGLWGYTGDAPDGEPLTVQSTGMGGPSAAVVVEELIALGVRTLVRTGTCGALVRGLALGELVTVSDVLPGDGASRALGAGEQLVPDPELTDALAAAGAARRVRAVSTDLFYDPRGEKGDWVAEGAEVVEMEAASVLRVAERHGARAACVLAVTDLLHDGRERIGPERVDELGVVVGELGARALGVAIRTR
jgi:uridine phosphorylase